MSEETPALVEESAIETPPMAEEGDYHYDSRFLSRVLEGAILASGEALSLNKMLTLFDEDKRPSKQLLVDTLEHIRDNTHDRGFILKEVASGWRFEVCDDLAPWVNRLWDEKPQRYSRALLETLALIAYRQPLTRGDIEDVRGVAVSSHIIKTLTEREWVKVVGHRDVPGRPALYATTRQFLDYFGLKSLEELPSLGELKDIESLSSELALGIDDANASPDDNESGDLDDAQDQENTPVSDDSDPQAGADQDNADVEEQQFVDTLTQDAFAEETLAEDNDDNERAEPEASVASGEQEPAPQNQPASEDALISAADSTEPDLTKG